MNEADKRTIGYLRRLAGDYSQRHEEHVELHRGADRIEELEAVVRALAAVEYPTVFDNDDTMPSFVCGVCRMGGPGDAPKTARSDHAEGCPWRLARELIGDSE